MIKKSLRKADSLLRTANPFLRAFYFVIGAGLVLVGLSLLWAAFTPIPDLDSFGSRKVPLSTKIYDREGKTVLYDLNPDVRRQIIPLEDISPYIQQATIAIEDKEFYSHMGISITGIGRAIITDIRTGSLAQGGSTITQQVVKNTLLTREKSFIRKLHEVVLAFKLEQRFTKDEILALYLNYIPYGGVFYGAESSSRAFFGKSAKDVTIAEAAYLAALPQAPTYYSPYGNHREALDHRKNVVLAEMYRDGFITEEELESARREVVTFRPPSDGSIIAPHFVFYIREYLEEKYGSDVVHQGLSVITTLDADLQAEAESIVYDYAMQNATRFNATNAALVAIDPKTGHILTMVGSRDYFDSDIDGNYNIAIANRQPGSSFKPFVYAAALAKGFTTQTAVYDVPTQFSTACAPSDVTNNEFPCYAPSNYDETFRGQMTFTTALAQSVNIPAVKALYLAGIDNVIDLGRRAGVSTLGEARQYGLSFALGAAEIKLLELTNAYGIFAYDGNYHAPVGILKITDLKGNVLEEYKEEPKQVLDPGVARDVAFMLSNNEARFPAYSAANPFTFPGYDVAAKTGTTNEYRDAWTVGFTPNIVVGVWAGNNNNEPMVKEVAGFIVSPMWNAFMQKALASREKEFFGEPRPIPENAPPALRGVGGGRSILHWVNKDDPLGGGTSQGDGQYRYWENSIQGWNTNPFGAATSTESIIEGLQDLVDGLNDQLDEQRSNEEQN